MSALAPEAGLTVLAAVFTGALVAARSDAPQ